MLISTNQLQYSLGGLILITLPITCLAGKYEDQVRLQFELIRLAALKSGWEETHNPKYDKLNNGESDVFTLKLRKGNSYKIYGVCDEDCKDLDLIVYDEDSNEISRDASSDSMPIVEVSPRWTGEFHLKVNMYNCENNPCFYGMSAIGR